jgi:hypothetical protein
MPFSDHSANKGLDGLDVFEQVHALGLGPGVLRLPASLQHEQYDGESPDLVGQAAVERRHRQHRQSHRALAAVMQPAGAWAGCGRV